MSAIRPRCSRCSGSASRSGRSTPCSSPTTPAMASWRGRAFDAGLIREVVQGIAERGVLRHCDGVLSGYIGSAEIGDGDSRCGGAGEARQSAGALLLRSGDRRCRARRVRAARHRRIHAGPRGAGRRHRHAEPFRARSSDRPHHDESGRGARGRRGVARAGAAHRAGDLAGDRRNAGRRHRSAGLRRCAAAIALRTPKLPISVNGAGDAIAALFFAHYLRTGSAAEALSRAASSVFGILKRTAEARFARNPADRSAGRAGQAEREHSAPSHCEAEIMRRRFFTLDVFTTQRFAGNPLAVVLDSGGLDDRRHADHRARVQSAGNGVRVSAGRSEASGAASHFHAGARIAVRRPSDGRNRGAARASRRRRRRARNRLGRGDRTGRLQGAARQGRRQRQLRHSEIARERPAVLRTRQACRGASLEAGDLGSTTSCRTSGRRAIHSPSCRCAASKPSAARGPTCRCGRGVRRTTVRTAPFCFAAMWSIAAASFHARMFAPAMGIVEDPATGSAAAAFAGVLAASGPWRWPACRGARAGLRDGPARA